MVGSPDSNRSALGQTRKRRRRLLPGGQTLVEFALVLPVFLVLVFGIVDFSLALKAWLTVSNSAREGARVLVVGKTCDQVTTQAQNVAAGLNPPVTVTITPSTCTGSPGDSMTVQVSYTYTPITPLGSIVHLISGGSMPSSYDITSTAVMRHE